MNIGHVGSQEPILVPGNQGPLDLIVKPICELSPNLFSFHISSTGRPIFVLKNSEYFISISKPCWYQWIIIQTCGATGFSVCPDENCSACLRNDTEVSAENCKLVRQHFAALEKHFADIRAQAEIFPETLVCKQRLSVEAQVNKILELLKTLPQKEQGDGQGN